MRRSGRTVIAASVLVCALLATWGLPVRSVRAQVAGPELGLQVKPVDRATYSRLGMRNPRGLVVTGVVYGGAGRNAGIEVGEVLISFNGQPLDRPDQLRDLAPQGMPDGMATVQVFSPLTGRERDVRIEVRRAQRGPQPSVPGPSTALTKPLETVQTREAAAPTGSPALALTSPSWPGVVELKSGQRVEGNLQQATAAGVMIEVGGQTITLGQEQVRAIYFGGAPGPAKQAPAIGEALRALKALQSVTTGGITYRDYAPRVNDAKIQVDRYLQESGSSDSPERTAIMAAMNYFVLASSAWNAKITSRGYESLASAAARDPCVHLHLADRPPDRGGLPLETGIGIWVVATGVLAIWSCASDKIAEAERALQAQPGGAQK